MQQLPSQLPGNSLLWDHPWITYGSWRKISFMPSSLCAGGWAWGIRQSSGALSWAPSSEGWPEGALCSPHGDPLDLGKPSPRTPCSCTWEAKNKDCEGSKIQLLASKRELENKTQYCSSWKIVKQMFHFLQRWPQSCCLSLTRRRLVSLICTSFAFQKMSRIL